MASPEAEATPEPEAKPSSKGAVIKYLLIGIGAFVLVTLSQAIAPVFTESLTTMLADRKAAQEAEALAGPQEEGQSEGDSEEESEPLEEPLYAPLNPPMVVNFANDASGFLQVEIQVMARDKDIIKLVKANEPAVRSALLMLFAGKTRDDVTTREGKEKLREEALSEVRQVIAPYVHEGTVEDVYFTSLIAQ